MEILIEKQQAKKDLNEYFTQYLNTNLDLWELYSQAILEEEKAYKDEVIFIIKKYLGILTVEDVKDIIKMYYKNKELISHAKLNGLSQEEIDKKMKKLQEKFTVDELLLKYGIKEPSSLDEILFKLF